MHEADEGIKIHSRRCPRAIQLNGLGAHLLHVLCSRCLCCSCIVVKRFMSKGDGALSKSFIIIIIIIIIVVVVVVVALVDSVVVAAAAAVVVKSSVCLVFSVTSACKPSGCKDARTPLQTVYFPVL